MDGTLAQIITDLMQSQQIILRQQQQVEVLTKERDSLLVERDALNAQLAANPQAGREGGSGGC